MRKATLKKLKKEGFVKLAAYAENTNMVQSLTPKEKYEAKSRRIQARLGKWRKKIQHARVKVA